MTASNFRLRKKKLNQLLTMSEPQSTTLTASYFLP